ncbi:MAG: hypothetical protein ACRCU0_03625 [Candidatus Rhabdochlamydia sp.]
MSKDKEIEGIEAFFKGDVEYKGKHLNEMLYLLNNLMVDVKEVFSKGSREQQKASAKKFKRARHLVYDYLDSTIEKLGLEQDQVQLLVSYFLNTASPDRDQIVILQKEFEKNTKEVETILDAKLPQKKKRGPLKKYAQKSSWVQS